MYNVQKLPFLPVSPTFFRQEKQRFFFLFLSGVWSLSDDACAASPCGSEKQTKKNEVWTNKVNSHPKHDTVNKPQTLNLKDRGKK